MRIVFHTALAVAAAGIVALAVTFSDASAAEKKKAAPACNSLTTEAACEARDDCSWVNAVVDKKTNKQKRKAYCRTKPKPPVKKKTEKKS